ncbi:MAG: response regulator, partial [candidate division Zixibacteria bacterium]|nr:response regulator [candidate division Zixibacteria bacterium]
MILIVDDERYIRSSLSGLLKDEGYKTETAESAEKAESLIKKNRYDLILLDIQMAGKDGI